MKLSGQLITLDRTYPLVRIDGRDIRAEYSVAFSRDDQKATVGDRLELDQPQTDAVPQITGVLPRDTLLARRICIEHPSVGTGLYEEQLLAANFDRVFVVTGLGRHDLDLNYLESQLVACFESGGRVGVLLNKVDLATGDVDQMVSEVQQLADELDVLAVSTLTGQGIEQLGELCSAGSMSVFFGRSGVGKSALINALTGKSDQAVGQTRQRDQAGRHTTVNRQMIFSDGRAYFDTPGVRSIGNYLHVVGLEGVFDDVISLAAKCRFRDCRHLSEPGCAVREAINNHTLTERRLNSFIALAAEVSGENVAVGTA
jgi:ribosome biogenesis GTPase